MTELSLTLADRLHMTPFELFREDCEEVILIVNHFIEKGSTGGENTTTKTTPENNFNDGFWDF